MPITPPSKALNKGSGFLGRIIWNLIAQKKPIINKGPNIHGRGMLILYATKPPNTAKNILNKYFNLFYQYKFNILEINLALH